MTYEELKATAEKLIAEYSDTLDFVQIGIMLGDLDGNIGSMTHYIQFVEKRMN